ncbi:MAG: hypothetical protein AABY22_24985, partial [Nanoarchaeota archaeon]
MNREKIQLTAQIISADTEELFALALEKGIQMPHPSLGIFKSVLAEIEKPNANKIRLGEEATRTAVDTLIGTQINKNHSVRKDPRTLEFIQTPEIMGHVIDAKINKEKEKKIEIVCIFFKQVYSNEWEQAQQLFDKNQLTMSFELSTDIESQDKLKDGTKRLNDYYFTGAGLLFGVAPACKNARVFEMATKELYNKLAIERQALVFATSQNIKKSIMDVLIQVTKQAEELKAEEIKAEEPTILSEELTKTANTITEKVEANEGENIMNKEQKKLISELRAELDGYLPKETKDEELLIEAKVAEFRKIKADAIQAKVEAESKVAEVKSEVKVEVTPEVKSELKADGTSTTVREETQKVTTVTDGVSNSQSQKVETTCVVTQDDVQVVNSKSVQETVYTYA